MSVNGLQSPHSGDTDNLQSSVGEQETQSFNDEEVEYEGETYKLAPEGYEGTDDDLELDGKIYTKEELDTLAPTLQPIDAEPVAQEEGGVSVSGPSIDSTIPANYKEYKKTGEVVIKENNKLVKVPVYETYKDTEHAKTYDLKNKEGNKSDSMDFKKKDLSKEYWEDNYPDIDRNKVIEDAKKFIIGWIKENGEPVTTSTGKTYRYSVSDFALLRAVDKPEFYNIGDNAINVLHHEGTIKRLDSSLVLGGGGIVLNESFSRKNIKRSEEANGNCDFCMGTGRVIVEKLGLKDCPRCDDDGNIEQQNNGFGQEVPTEPIGGIQQKNLIEDPTKQENPTEPKEKPEEKNPFSKENYRKCIGESCSTCPNDLKNYTDYIFNQLDVVKTHAIGNETVGVFFGNEIKKKGKKVQGTLAYAGFSLNDRIYSPEELAKGDGMTVPLIINHASTVGAEKEIAEGRVPDEVVQALQRGEDYVVGEVTLEWNPSTLTLSYSGVINDTFWQDEVEDAKMAVSLGIYYDADSPRLCNDKCYTVIQGAEFREVSLVYHPGFPIATIEAVENYLKKSAVEYGNTDLFKRKERADEMSKKTNYKFTGLKSFTVGSSGNIQTFAFDSSSDNYITFAVSTN